MSAATERKGETIKVVVLDRRKTEIDLCDTEEEMRSMTVLQLKEMVIKTLPEYAGGDMKMVNLCNTEEQMRSMTVKQLKDKIIERIPEYGVHSDNIRLIFTNKDLHVDSALLSEYGITHLSVIQMVMKIPGGGDWPEPGTGDGGMGDKDGRNASKERLANFETP